MFEAKNVKNVKGSWKIQNSKFNLQRSQRKFTLEEFLELANKLFLEAFGFEPKFVANEDHKRSKTPPDDFTAMVYNRYKSMCQRCKDAKYSEEPSVKRSPQMISYKKRNITLEMTKDEFIAWMWEQKPIHDAIVANGDRSSVDRIDENLGYSLSNIQLLALHSNIEKRVGKECKRWSKEELADKRARNAKRYKNSQKEEK